MRSGKAATASLIAALVLALLTGGVFWVLQDYGPESALRKFHRASINHEWRDLGEVVMSGSYRQNVEVLANMVETYARLGARYQLQQVRRQNGKVLARVEYVFPNGRRDPVFWVVDKAKDGWRVNVNETMGQRMDQFGLGPL